ncbi:MAG: sulfite exporter TauE/SafE family protein [Burkholderiales bacterium]
MNAEIALPWPVWIATAVTIFIAGFAQGALGFGFPAISAPVLTLMMDVKAAIVLNLLPNFAVNLYSTLRGGNWRASLGRYWPVAVWVLVGSWAGVSVLLLSPQEPLRVLLAAVIFFYLYQQRLARLDWTWLTRYPRLSAAVFGLAGGFFSGAVNLALPPLLIYFLLLGLEAQAMTQILNLCFLGGKTMQGVMLGAAGAIRLDAVLANIPLTFVAFGGLLLGQRLQSRFSGAQYQRVLRVALSVIALLLIGQAAWGWWGR